MPSKAKRKGKKPSSKKAEEEDVNALTKVPDPDAPIDTDDEDDRYFNRTEVLDGWGFSSNECRRCGIQNSELKGVLMQCNKCKKAYYCSVKCFNRDLPNHQKFCTTKEIFAEPKRPEPLRMTKAPPRVVEPESEDEVTVEDEPEPEPEPESSESEPAVEVESESSESEVEEAPEPEPEPEALQEETYEERKERARQLYERHFGFMPEAATFERETVELRHVDMNLFREFGWEIPEWALKSPLKQTEKGKALKEGTETELARPANVLIEKGLVTWEKPSWAIASPLRKTNKGKVMLEKGNLAKRSTKPASMTRQDSSEEVEG